MLPHPLHGLLTTLRYRRRHVSRHGPASSRQRPIRGRNPRSAPDVGLVGLAALPAWIAVSRALRHGRALCGAGQRRRVRRADGAVVAARRQGPPQSRRTGLDWAHARPWRETIDISITKLAGLWVTWGGIALIYSASGASSGRAISRSRCGASRSRRRRCSSLSVPYVLWLDRRLVEPRDGAWAFGAWLIGSKEPLDREAIRNHLRSWAVKGFFLAFMISIVPPGFGEFIRASTGRHRSPIRSRSRTG